MTDRRSSFVLLAVLVPLLTFFVGMNLGASRAGAPAPSWFSTAPATSDVDQRLLGEVVDDLRKHYYKPDSITPTALSYGAAQGVVDALGDPHSVFFPPEDAQDFQDTIQGALDGIGAELTISHDRPSISATIRDTPAQKAGLKAGDVILKIDGTDTAKMPLSKAVKLIRGPRGTAVTLSILHRDATEVEEVRITREHVEIPSVKWEMRGTTAVITLFFFRSGSGDELVRAAQEALGKGAKAVVLDLRDDPGGVLDEAVKTVALFVESGTVVTQRGRTSERVYAIESGRIILTSRSEQNADPEKSVLAPARPYLKDLPLVVLMNESSASASEIVAGALQDAGRAKLVGTKSYGKGTVQELIPIDAPPQGASMKLTIAEWFTPKGRSIEKVGLTPDVEVAFPDETPEGQDPQLDAALKLVQP